MFEELKTKNDELKDVIDKIEELTPWDRDNLFNEISEIHIPDEERILTLSDVFNNFDSDDIAEELYRTDNYIYIADMVNNFELSEFIQRAIDTQVFPTISVKYILDDLYKNNMRTFKEWIKSMKDDDDFRQNLSELLN